ncbi:MAG: DUF3369 domain-containing protein [Alphaproteobacteria bacterium]|nr:DUF3369 domain-containing protein [Alphaproteobacteria bacterium]
MRKPFVFAPPRGRPEDAPQSEPPWTVLVVDDDQEVQSVTELILAKVRFKGRPIELLRALSEAEARAIMAERPDVAVILLDVVMESDDAGLRLVRHIREDLRNRAVRIILRTGQPGQAPEQSVIVDYDINDYKAKTELTAQKLFTTTIAALRAYEDIRALETSREALFQIIEASDSLFRVQSMHQFASAVLSQLAALTGAGPSGLLCLQVAAGQRPRPESIAILGSSGAYARLASATLAEASLPEALVAVIIDALESHHEVRVGPYLAYYVRVDGVREAVVVLDAPRRPVSLGQDVMQLFGTKIALGFGNAFRYEALTDERDRLTSEVDRMRGSVEAAHREVQSVAQASSLTGLLTPELFEVIGHAEAMRAVRYRRPLTLLRLGLVVADEDAEALARACQPALRRSDVIGRLADGGIAVLMAETDRESGLRAAERVAEAIAAANLSHGTMTIAVAPCDLDRPDTVEAALAKATALAAGEGPQLRIAWNREG